MSNPSFLSLAQNAALLLATAYLFDLIGTRFRTGKAGWMQIPVGVMLGGIGVVVMLTPWVHTPGIIFDTRSVLLGISGLFYGLLPTVVAMMITIALRIYQGGAATVTGISVILATGLLGLAWRHFRRQPLETLSGLELYLFGIALHITMLGLMLTLPWDTALKVLSVISLPVLIIYPLATALFGLLMVNRLRRQQMSVELDRTTTRLASLVGILQHPVDTTQEYLDYALDEAIRLTGSKIGFLCFYNQESQQFVLNSWSKEVMQECTVVEPQTCYELDKTGIWGEAVRQRKPILVNDFQAEHPLKKGTPDGHVVLRKFLTVPIFSGQETVAVIGVANKDTDYDQNDITQLGLLLDTVWKVVERKQAQEELRQIEWMLTPGHVLRTSSNENEPPFFPAYGDLTTLNTERLILDTVGEQTLNRIAGEYLDLLDTSSAVYEKNGDYAMGIFSSGWCRFMDQAARNLCNTDDNRQALESGKWLCHESCWKDACKVAIERGEITDIECAGGIHLYAVPIWAGGEVIGAINVGYGDPPRDQGTLMQLAEKYRVNPKELRTLADTYQTRPPFIIELAKKRLEVSARWIGEIVERRLAEEKTRAARVELERLLAITDQSRLALLSLVEDQKKAEDEIRQLNTGLEQRVRERTAQLEAANHELEAFAYSVSHDLRAPLRAMDGFSAALLSDHAAQLNQQAVHYLNRIQQASQRMGQLINDLLDLSRVTRREMKFRSVDLSNMAQEICADLQMQYPQRQVETHIAEGIFANGDPHLLHLVLENLLSNAWKFTNGRQHPHIEVGWVDQNYFVRDNGVGFDMTYAGKLFTPFQRLHAMHEYPGTGIGLATVRRIITRHGGRVWVEAVPNQGATFYFTLGEDQ